MAWPNCWSGLYPVTVGRIEDWGWALHVQGCAEGCWPSAYFSDETWVSQLRPYAGTGTIFRFFGGMGCCSVEGPSMGIDRWEFGTCDVTSVARTSWGHLKTIYR